MYDLAPVIRDLAVILIVASIVILIFHKIRQPIVLGYLVAGMIVGPYTPPHALVKDIADVHALSELGVIFLMFSLGLDFSFHKLKQVGFSASITGIIEVVFMLLVGFIVARLMGWSFNDSLFLGAAISISSTMIIIKALDELRLKTRHFAKIVFGILVVEDLLAILLLVFLSTAIVSNTLISTHVLWAALKLVIIVGGWFLIGYFLVPPLFRRFMRYVSKETLTIVSVALCLALVSVAAYFDYSVALGAFIMGSILAETNLINRIEEVIQPLRDIFAAVFFVSVGMLIQPKLIFEHFTLILFLSAVTIIGKLFITSIGSFLTGQTVNNSLRIGFSMAQIGEFSFIIIGLGAALNAISDKVYPIIVAVAVITTFTTPYMIKLSDRLSHKFEEKLNEKTKLFLKGYSSWIYRVLSRSEGQPILRKISTRLILNGMVVAIIFSLVEYFILPQLLTYAARPMLMKLLAWIIALAISSPFIWAMLSAFQLNHRTPKRVWSHSKATLFFTWSITFAEVAYLSVDYFDTWVITTAVILMAIIYFVLLYRHLERSYHWFEKQLLRNVKLKGFKEESYQELAPWDTVLLELEVSRWSPLVGKSIKELKLPQRYSIIIVAIYRGNEIIFAPRSSQVIFPLDKLIILGQDEKNEQFRKSYLDGIEEPIESQALDGYALQTIYLTSDHPFVGYSIRELVARHEIKGCVVGLEHGGVRVLNPPYDTILQIEDTLYILSDPKSMQAIPSNDVSS